MVKTAVLAPIPRARVTMAVAAKPGRRTRLRRARRTSCTFRVYVGELALPSIGNAHHRDRSWSGRCFDAVSGEWSWLDGSQERSTAQLSPFNRELIHLATFPRIVMVAPCDHLE